MSQQPCPRPVGVIDADLRSCHASRRDAERQLAEVRDRRAELAELEAVLVLAVESRSRSADRLLDERLHAGTAVQPRGLVGAG